MAISAEEGRGKLRKATERCKQPLTRRYPNGGTRQWLCTVTHTIEYEEGTWGTETSNYPEEEYSNEIFLVAASERERGQTGAGNRTGVEDSHQV